MSLRNITVQYLGDVLYLPPLERVVNHIIARKDVNDLEHFVSERTCHFTEFPDEYLDELGIGYCSECGEELYDNYLYCPNCGAKVVSE